MTTNVPNPISEALEAVSAPVKAEVPNPAREPHDAALEARLTRLRDAARGADPVIDGQMTALERRTLELDRVVYDAARLRAQGESGAVPAHVVDAALQRVEEEVRKGNRAALTAAVEAGKVGRERLLRELLPEPEASPVTADVKADLREALGAYSDPVDAFVHAFDEALGAQSQAEIALLAGRWGERAFRARGGTEKAWQGLRDRFFAALADRARKEDPRSRSAKAWSIVTGRDFEQFLHILTIDLERRAEKVRR